MSLFSFVCFKFSESKNLAARVAFNKSERGLLSLEIICMNSKIWLYLNQVAVLLGNKLDKTEQRVVSTQVGLFLLFTEIALKEGKTFADENQLMFYEVSALSGFNVHIQSFVCV
jgi:hypothetical protein